MKKDLLNISNVYSRVWESSMGEPSDHKQKMINLASEIAAIATRVSSLKVRRGDGERLLELAREIESEYI